MLLPRAGNHAALFAGTVASPGYVAFPLGAWLLLARQHVFRPPW